MKHWSEDDFLNWLYAGDVDSSHLEECESCRARAAQMSEARRKAATPPAVSWEFLAAQRRTIYKRLDIHSGHSIAKRWAVAAASLICIVALSLATLRPWTSKAPLYTSSDEKLFSDLAAIEQTSEPRTIRPLHNLFQE